MNGMEEFMNLFGDITVGSIVNIIVGLSFAITLYKEIKKYLNARTERERQKDDKLNKALDISNACQKKYLELENKFISDKEEVLSAFSEDKQAILERLNTMEAVAQVRERNKTRECLLRLYRHYTSLETNPNQSWSELESQTFWELFHDYEDAGGDGLMHTEVQPAMLKLKIK